MVELTDTDITAALARGEAAMRAKRAQTVRYDASTHALLLALTDGTRLLVPVLNEPSLVSLDAATLATVQVRGAGLGIHFPSIDLDLSVAALGADALAALPK